MNSKDLFAQIAQLAGLHYDADVSVIYFDQPDFARARYVDAWLANPADEENAGPRGQGVYDRALSGIDPVYQARVDSGIPSHSIGNSPPVRKPSIFDVLGEYKPQSRQIIIYVSACRLIAGGLGLSPELVKHVVLTHQVVHAVTHLGHEAATSQSLPSGDNWHDFEHADPLDTEFFAQVYSRFYFQDYTRYQTSAGYALQDLAAREYDYYDNWRGEEYRSIADVNQLLLETRRKYAEPGRRQEQEAPAFTRATEVVALIKAGKKAEAQRLLEPFIEANPHHIQAWMWEVETWPTVEGKIKVLELCLQHNPRNSIVQQALAAMKLRSGSGH